MEVMRTSIIIFVMNPFTKHVSLPLVQLEGLRLTSLCF